VGGAEQGSMNRRNACFSALIVLGALTTSCSSDSKSSSTTAAPATTAAVATTAAAATAPTTAGGELPSAASVEIKQFKFGPEEIHIAVGGTVTWSNSDNQKHTATASGGFDTGAIEGAATGTATFSTAGTFAYMCSFHPFMKGTVVVGS
jgi:plastocyanin